MVRGAIPRPLRRRLYDWSPWRRKRWQEVPGITRVPAAAGAALTFDDGPDLTYTPRLLEALDAAGAKATFFVVGERVPGAEELLREIEARGHEIALHGMTHRRHDELSDEEARAELTDGLAAIATAGVARPRLYRPPYGGSSPVLARYCEELELGLAYWSSWGQDWDPIGAGEIAELVIRDLEPGAVILLHDSPVYAPREDVGPTITAIEPIALAARAQGLQLQSMSTALDGGA